MGDCVAIDRPVNKMSPGVVLTDSGALKGRMRRSNVQKDYINAEAPCHPV